MTSKQQIDMEGKHTYTWTPGIEISKYIQRKTFRFRNFIVFFFIKYQIIFIRVLFNPENVQIRVKLVRFVTIIIIIPDTS